MDILVESTLRVTVLAMGVAVVLRALKIRSPRLAHGAWACVTIIMLLLPLFVAWGPEVAVPLLPSRAEVEILLSAVGDAAPTGPETIRTIAPSAPARAQTGIRWTEFVGALYIAGVGLLLLRLALGIVRARAIRGAAIQAQGRLTHPACVTPLTVGVVAPTVILPADWASWDEGELSAVLAHEEEHVRRRDPLVAALALLNRAIFWFHPLAWWLQREISRLSEQACDAAVISQGHNSEVYSSCLLRFARRVTDVGGRIAPISMAMPGAGLQERLGMLAHAATVHPSDSRLACAVTACAVLAVVCTAAAPTAAPLQDVPALARNQPGWAVQTSDHFEFFHEGLPSDRLNDVVREAEAAYAELSAALAYDIPRRVPIILVLRDRDVQDAVAQGRDVVLQSGAPAGQRVVIPLESLDRRTGIVVHELSHVFAFEIIPDTGRIGPSLIEGLAEHHRGAWEAEDVRRTRAAVATASIPSVASVTSSGRHWAHALFDFVAAQRGPEGVRQLLFALRANETIERALPVAFGVTLEQVNQSFRGYVTTRFGQP